MSNSMTKDDITKKVEEISGYLEYLDIKVVNDSLELSLPDGNVVYLPIEALVEGSELNLTEIKKEIQSNYSGLIEIYDKEVFSEEYHGMIPITEDGSVPVTEFAPKFFANSGRRHRTMGRVFSHWKWEWRGIHSRKVNYYKYLELHASPGVGDNEWEEIAKMIFCVIATIGLLLLLSMLPGGAVIIKLFLDIFIVVAAICFGLSVAQIIGGSAGEKSYVTTRIGR